KIENKGYEKIYIVDLALHENSLKRLAEIAKIKVFDHHLTKKLNGIEHINPIIEGSNEEDFPSASWVVGSYLNQKNLLAFLGVVGDWEERIKNTRFYSKLEKFMEENELSFEEMHDMVKLIDANYKAGDKKEVEKAPKLLANAENKKEFIISNKKWKENKKKVEEEIKKALEVEEEIIDGILVKRIRSKCNIISTIARELWKKNDYVIVINDGFFEKDSQVYVRGNNVYHLIDLAKSKGYVAGGKKNVVGAIVPKEECEKFIEIILEKIK
ncbi:MAG: single-stranded DNA-specific exonuclease, partial [Thermoplasmata archaeon]|nr:single-stranded DNA-specific exonuclease [Thermoplasmata archaeon]